jgi:Peptidase MA superfamily
MSLLAPLLSLLLAVAPPPQVDEPVAPAMPSSGTAAGLATGSVDTPRFHLVYTAQAKAAALTLSGQIEKIRDEVAVLVGRDWPGVTEVRLGYGREEYEGLSLPGAPPPSWAVALAYPEQNIVLVETHSLVQGDGQLTLRHELIHVALGQLGHGWPRWFQEGLAMELTGERRFRVTQFATLSRAVSLDRVFRFDDLAMGFPRYADDVEIAYAQSAAFVEYLRDHHGSAAFGTLIDHVQAGEPFEQAFGVAFHSSISMEERGFRTELPRRYPWWPLVLSGGSLVWAASSILMVAAWARRRRQVGVARAEQARVEHLEDLSQALLAHRFAPANTDVDDTVPWGDWSEAYWLVHSVRVQRVTAQARSKTTHFSDDGTR